MGGSSSRDLQEMRSREWNGAGKVALVTGPIAGLGFETARWLAKSGCHVVLAGRGKERLRECAEKIRAQCTQADGSPLAPERVQLMELELDLASLASVAECARAFQQTGLPLHLLVNNAGVMMTPFSHTADGVELQMGVNHVGHFCQSCCAGEWKDLTRLLLPQLQASAPSRVVTVSSGTHALAKLSAPTLDAVFNPTSSQYGAISAYANSKIANILFTHSLQSKYGPSGVTAYAPHPGAAKTQLERHSRLVWLLSRVGACFMKTAEEGAGTTIYCATNPDAQAHAGGYFGNCAHTPVTHAAMSDECAEALWHKTAQVIVQFEAKRQGQTDAPSKQSS